MRSTEQFMSVAQSSGKCYVSLTREGSAAKPERCSFSKRVMYGHRSTFPDKIEHYNMHSKTVNYIY